MKELILGVLLVIQGCIDLKHKEIPLWISLLGAGIGGGFFLKEEREIISLLVACVPGIIALLFARISGEVIGYGDGVLFLMMGIYLPIEKILSTGMLAFSIAGVVALVLLVVFHKKGNYRIPFIPFLSVAYMLEYFIGMGEGAL